MLEGNYANIASNQFCSLGQAHALLLISRKLPRHGLRVKAQKYGGQKKQAFTPRGVLPYKGLMGTCSQPGYVFRDFCLKQGIEFITFCLNQGIGLSIFFLNKVSFLGR